MTQTARKNLKRVYGDDIDIESTINDLWDNYGRYIGEFPFINGLDSAELDKRVKVIGLEKVEAFQKTNQPFMLFLGHQANWDFVIRKINDIYPKFGIAYRAANNPYVDKKILQERANDTSITMIAKGTSGAKSIIRAIKSGASIAMLVDQKMNNGIEVPFFGFPAMTAVALARLSLQYKYPIVPLQIVRIGKSSNFELILHDPLEPSITKDIEKDCYNIMLEVNKTLEQWIREKPEQWFWFHNRWKN
ncbi:MAG: lipid A biosynthesis lauroyl acyltransferase [Rickettsiaceae bacterium]|nr:lipid A biosynthesis lauroyl acyltransferase [Rickettsiaceae bacterium]